MKMMRERVSRLLGIGLGFAGLFVLAGCLGPIPNQSPEILWTVLPSEGYAPLSIECDASGSYDPDSTTLDARWTFGDGETGIGLATSHTYLASGSYELTLTVTDPDGGTSTETKTIHVRDVPSGYIMRRMAWQREGAPRVWELLIPYQLYQEYRGRIRNPFVDNYLYGDYVIDPKDDPTIEDYARVLWNRVGQDDDDFLIEALAFVQGAIAYQSDPNGTEHPLYPLETLTDGRGDCEDTAILFVSLLRALDMPCKLAFVDTTEDGTPDHVLAFVAVSNRLLARLDCAEAVKTFAWDGQLYVIAETAVDHGAYTLGCDPWNLDEDDISEIWSFPES